MVEDVVDPAQAEAEKNRELFTNTVLRNPFIPFIPPTIDPETGLVAIDPKSGQKLWGRPSPKQIAFLCYFGDEAMYGGAAGGGKSDSLLMAALQFVSVPTYSAIIFRRSLKMLEKADGLIPRSLEWPLTANGAKYNYTKREWKFPSGATLEFGYIDHRKDLDNYQGGKWNFLAFDEAGQFEPEFIKYLFSRKRKALNSLVPNRFRLASNPGGKGHEFLKRRYVSPGAPKYFISSRLEDNPGLDQADYTKSLQELDPILRAQLLGGDWNAYEGGRFKREWFREFYVQKDYNGSPRYHLQIGKDKQTNSPIFDDVGILVNQCWNCVVCDPACTEDDTNCPTAIGAFAITPNRDILVLKVVRKWLDIDAIVPEIAEICVGFAPSWVAIEDDGAFAAISSAARKHPSIPAVKSISHESKSKLVRNTAAIIRAENGGIYTPPLGPRFPWVEDYLAELVQWTGDSEQDAFSDQADITGHLCRTIDRMGFGSGPQVVYHNDAENRRVELLEAGILNASAVSLIESDEWDDEPTFRGGLTGWKP